MEFRKSPLEDVGLGLMVSLHGDNCVQYRSDRRDTYRKKNNKDLFPAQQ
jgi:hypothetical protein